MAYPLIFRQRALDALRKGKTREEINEMFGLGVHTLKRWEKLEEETGSLDKRPLDRSPGIDLDALRKYCEDFPFATHIEVGVHFNCSERVVCYAKDKLGITRKKRQLITQSEMSKQESNLSKG